MTEKKYQLPQNCDFMKLISANNFSNDCSPKLSLEVEIEGKFEGILINAPAEMTWNKKDMSKDYPVGINGETYGPLRLMVTGFIQLKYQYLDSGRDFHKKVLMVAVNQKTAEAYSGRMSKGDIMWMPMPEAGQKALAAAREAMKDRLVEDHFTLDLVHDLGLPIADATYTVYATLGEYKSNSLTIKTVVK